jgi:predicted nucleic acid-binding protein
MLDRAFVDTNILVYLYSADEPYKRTVSTNVFRSYSEPVVSIPILNELCNVMLRKLGVSNAGVRDAVREISEASLIAKVSTNTIQKAIDMHEKYGFTFFDSFHLATAAENACSVFFSEDLQHGQKIGNLKIVNPFRA